VPAVIDLSLVAVGLGALVLLRLAGGSLPWGHLSIAVGPDGRPMRPRVKWHLWSVSRGEAPRLAALAGFASVALGCASLAVTVPRIIQTVFHPVAGLASYALIVVTAICCVLVPVGFTVLVRAGLDLTARRSSMVGQVVGMRRDLGLFGPNYRIAVQAGDRGMAKRLWAESFRIDHTTFKQLSPGDRISVEYSPHLRHVFRTTGLTDRGARAS
jgi:hypothetical protein